MSPNNDRFRVLRRLPEIKFEDELRGYSKSQVDRVLETLAPLADEVDELLARLSQAETRAASAEARLVQQGPSAAVPDTAAVAVVDAPPAEPETSQPPPDFDETLRKTLLLAQTTADETVRNANVEAEKTVADANDEAESLRSAARQESDDILAENKRTRTTLHDEVASERVRLLEEAQEEARTRLTSLEQELASAHGVERDRLLAEIEDLQKTRDQLRGDVELLEGHLAQRRGVLRTALSEMTDALDDPEKLRGTTGPDLTDPETVDSANYAGIALAEDSISTLSEDVGVDPTVSSSTFASDSAAADAADGVESEHEAADDAVGSDAEGHAEGNDVEALDVFGAGDTSGGRRSASEAAPSADDGDAPSATEESTNDGAASVESAETVSRALSEEDAHDAGIIDDDNPLDGPEGEWVEEQFGLVEDADNSQPAQAPPEPPDEAQPGSGPTETDADATQPLPRRTSSTRNDVRTQQQSLGVESAPEAGSGGWLSDDEGAAVSWDESLPTGEQAVLPDAAAPAAAMPDAGLQDTDVPATATDPFAAAEAASMEIADIPDVPAPPAGVATQIGDGSIPEQPAPPAPTQRPADIAADRERPAWADSGQHDNEALKPAAPSSSDPFLDELRRVTDEEVDDDDALGRFLNDDEGAAGRGGWFGRRK